MMNGINNQPPDSAHKESESDGRECDEQEASNGRLLLSGIHQLMDGREKVSSPVQCKQSRQDVGNDQTEIIDGCFAGRHTSSVSQSSFFTSTETCSTLIPSRTHGKSLSTASQAWNSSHDCVARGCSRSHKIFLTWS